MSMTAIVNFPKTKAGRIDMFELYRLCSKNNVDTQLIENVEPWELLLIIEGKVEQQREYFEFLNYSLYNAVGQVLSTKNKQFENPFTKKETEVKEKPSKEIESHTMDVLSDIFGFNKDDKEEESEKENGI